MDPTRLFLKSIEGSDQYQKALDLLDKIDLGNTWLIGGMIYRGIASSAFGIKSPIVDLDFIVEKRLGSLDLPNPWTYGENRFGNPKISNGTTAIDIIPLSNISSIKDRQLKPTIENFLSGTPLDIQSIAFEVKSAKVIGNLGIKAVFDQTVGVNDYVQLVQVSRRYGISPRQYMEGKADSLGFKIANLSNM